MTRRMLFASLLGVVILLAGGIGLLLLRDDDSPLSRMSETPTPAPTFPEVNEDQVSVGADLALIRGHHRVAQELYSKGETESALEHARSAVEEIMVVLGEQLNRRNIEPHRLEQALTEVVGSIEGDRGSEAVERAVKSAKRITKREFEAYAEEPDEQLLASVVSSVVRTASAEYAKALVPKGPALVIEYQNAYGFAKEAMGAYELIRDAVEATEKKDAEALEEAWAALNDALPSVELPSELVAGEEVEQAAATIGHELEKILGALPHGERNPEEVAYEITRIIAEVIEEYEEGDPEEAAELAVEAYLLDYELIEPEIIKAAPEINAELERLLGTELRRQILERAPLSEIEATSAQVERLLQRAVKAVERAQ